MTTASRDPIAYFCAEFGLRSSLPIYSGGLGVLAGDHCRAATELDVPLVGIGLLYRAGYFEQRLDADGWQADADATFDLEASPADPVLADDGSRALVRLPMDGRPVAVGAWRVDVDGVSVYLLDTDLEENEEEARRVTRKLYAGGEAHRIRQEWVLGAGGVRVLRELGVEPAVWHANEGHAGFMLVERLRHAVAGGDIDFEEALGRVRATSVFTTHTPVPAGHDAFSPEIVEEVAGPVWEELGIGRDALMELARAPEPHAGGFHMTALCLRLCGRANGVSRRHGELTREQWRGLWPDREAGDIPVGHVTNGAHLGTWMADEVAELLDGTVPSAGGRLAPDPDAWDAVADLDDAEVWRAHRSLKEGLLAELRRRARARWSERWSEPGHLAAAGILLEPGVLTLGFARRFAEYKRAALVFRDEERLLRLLSDPERPVQIVFAGKAHPEDDVGKSILREVYGRTRDPRFGGRVAFLEGYDMRLAGRLVEGVDLWLNLPRPPLEACGTSGMKAAFNLVPQLATDDGWWAEGFNGDNGWRIPRAPDDTDVDAHDAEHLYRILEEEVVPAFYERDRSGVPRAWAARMKEALRVAGPRFNARRMVEEYRRDYYEPARRDARPHRTALTG